MLIQNFSAPNSYKKNNEVSFKGYFACPLKALYMQNYELNLAKMAQEVLPIAQREGFNIYLFDSKSINKLTPETNINSLGDKIHNKWAQDNLIFLPNGFVLYVNKLQDGNNVLLEASKKIIQKPAKQSRFPIKGGNVFIGKNSENKYFAIIGKNSLLFAAQQLFIEEQTDFDLTQIASSFGECNDENGFAGFHILETDKELNKNWQQQRDRYTEKAKKEIANAFELEPENIHYISQPHHHLDTQVRPLNYPYVLVNDPDLAIKILNNNNQCTSKSYSDLFTKSGESKLPPNIVYETTDLKNSHKYASTDQVIKELEEIGLKPIRVPGVLADNKLNYMNAIVHQKPNGKLVYITNKSNFKDLYKVDTEAKFEKYLTTQVPQIDSVEFISGPLVKEYWKPPVNYLTRTLTKQKSGIHCMVAEEPNFENW